MKSDVVFDEVHYQRCTRYNSSVRRVCMEPTALPEADEGSMVVSVPMQVITEDMEVPFNSLLHSYAHVHAL